MGWLGWLESEFTALPPSQKKCTEFLKGPGNLLSPPVFFQPQNVRRVAVMNVASFHRCRLELPFVSCKGSGFESF